MSTWAEATEPAGPAGPHALECTGLRKAFGRQQVLDGVDLVVPVGALVAILGPSGGGKTTLLRLVAGFDTADAGTVAVHGEVVEGRGRPVPPHRRRVGYVPQEGALFPHLSVAANVGFGLRRGAPRARRVAECLELVGLAGLERARPHELSGGQQQRVALARALAPRPEVVLLDEPFSSLDAGLRAQVRAEVCDVLRHAGATAVLVTHDQQEALSTADAVAVLLGGRIAQVDDPVTLYRRPADLDVARFVGEAVVVTGRAHDGVVDCPLGRLPLAGDDPGGALVAVVIRPEQLRVSAPAGSTAGVPATVLSCRFLGSEVVVDLAVAGVEAPVAARAASWDLPAVGSRVAVSVAGAVAAFAVPGASASGASGAAGAGGAGEGRSAEGHGEAGGTPQQVVDGAGDADPVGLGEAQVR